MAVSRSAAYAPGRCRKDHRVFDRCPALKGAPHSKSNKIKGRLLNVLLERFLVVRACVCGLGRLMPTLLLHFLRTALALCAPTFRLPS